MRRESGASNAQNGGPMARSEHLRILEVR
jgi:hypothetical protein